MPIKPKTLEPIDPDCGDLMTIKAFLKNVETGMFIDYDGYGNWATKTHILSNKIVTPSDFSKRKAIPPKGATHVLWYNR